MSLEQLLSATLHSADEYAPSPDLFAKVQRSIEEDNLHRLRIRNAIRWSAAATVAVVVFLLATVRIEDGRVDMSFISLEILTTALMVTTVAILGPSIRRFGQTYERAVFAGHPDTGAQVLKLLDIAYYLIFGAFIVMTMMFEPPRELVAVESQFSDIVHLEMERLGGLLLLMGTLHAVLLLTLPVVGLIHSANLRKARMAAGATSEDDGANKIDRGITVGVWVIAGYVLFQMVAAVLVILLGLGMGG